MAFEDRSEPYPAKNEVVVKTQAVCICGSDIHLYRGDHPYRTYPMIFGHEASGIVEAVGEGGTDLKVGDSVVLEPLIPCGKCYPCQLGRRNCCSRMQTIGVTTDGALADRFAVPAFCLHRRPEALPPEIAALAEPFAVGFHAASRGEIGDTDRIVILGAGPIGLATLAAAKQRGAHVAIVDLVRMRLEIAKRMGADLTVNSIETDPLQAVRDWTAGDGASVVVEAVGLPQTIESTIDLVADAGRVVIAGVTEEKFSIRGVDVTKKELTIRGTRNSLGRFQEAVGFVADHADMVSHMITHSFPFEEAIAAFELADKSPTETCKVVVLFEEQ
jgi:threonine dehydrogenase-like Zn-dependent dehydrogenase